MRRILAGVLGLVWVAYFAMVSYVFYYGQRWDFLAYHRASQSILDGTDLYGTTAGSAAYLYPPLLAQTIAPFTAIFSFDVVTIIWQAFNIVLLVLTLWWLSRYFAENGNRRWARNMWILPLLFTPFMQSYWVGQVSVIMLACFVGAWLLLKYDKPMWAGAVIALAAWIKVFPALVIVYFIWRRDWKVLQGVIIAGIGLALVQLIGGFAPMIAFFTDLLPELVLSGKENPEQGLFKNSSILGFTQKLFIETIDNRPLAVAENLITVVRYGLMLLFGAGTIWALIAPKPQQSDYGRAFDFEYAIMLILSMIFSSVVWVSSLPPVFFAYVLLLYRPTEKWMQWLGWVSFGIICFYFPMLLSRGDGVQWGWWWFSLGFFAIAILWSLLIIARRRVLV